MDLFSMVGLLEINLIKVLLVWQMDKNGKYDLFYINFNINQNFS